MAFEDPELTNFEKQSVLLANMYPIVPENTQKAIEMAIKFLDGGKDGKKQKEGWNGEREREGQETLTPRQFSFTKDENYIFSAFRQTHGVDLEAERGMHWWKFIALFMDLGGDTFFCSLVGLRKRIQSGKGTEDDFKMARELGDVYELDQADPRTPEQIEMDEIFDRALEGRE